MPHLGLPELLIILVIVVVIFGAGKLPQIGGAIGQSIREFRTATKSPDDEEEDKPAPRRRAAAAKTEESEEDDKQA